MNFRLSKKQKSNYYKQVIRYMWLIDANDEVVEERIVKPDKKSADSYFDIKNKKSASRAR